MSKETVRRILSLLYRHCASFKDVRSILSGLSRLLPASAERLQEAIASHDKAMRRIRHAVANREPAAGSPVHDYVRSVCCPTQTVTRSNDHAIQECAG